MRAAAVVAAAVVLAGAAPARGEWRRIERREGVTVHEREVEGTALRELAAETVVEAPPERVLEVVTDYEDYPRFMPNVSSVEVLERDDGTTIAYFRLDVPLVSDRDYTLRLERRRAGEDLLRLEFREANERGPPPVEGVARVETVRGAWTVERLEGGRSRVTYQVLSGAGGELPAWIANLIGPGAIVDTVKAVRDAAAAP